MIQFRDFLNESGAGGRIPHPYELVSTSDELIELFRSSIKHINPETSKLKFDGVNASVKYTDRGFALDRGSAKELDIRGVRPEELEERFGSGHGMIKIGEFVISVFDSATNSIMPELTELGLKDNSNLVLNIEYVDGKTNVIPYSKESKFIVIHGLREITPKRINSKTGEIKSRKSKDAEFDADVMQSMIQKLKKFANKKGFDVLGLVGVELKDEPDLDSVLNKKVTFNFETKPLKDWLKGIKIPKPMSTRQQLLIALEDPNYIPDDILNDVIIYYATIKLGNEIKNNTSAYNFQNTEPEEGIVINDPKYGKYKITGSFIVKNVESPFANEQR